MRVDNLTPKHSFNFTVDKQIVDSVQNPFLAVDPATKRRNPNFRPKAVKSKPVTRDK